MDPLWLSIAFALGFAVRMAGLPPLVGYLAAGFILNAMGARSGVLIPIISELGVTLLLFTIGLKLKIGELARPEKFGSASVHMFLNTLLYGALLMALSLAGLRLFTAVDWTSALLLAFSLSFSSTVFAVKVLEEKGEMESLHGSISIGVLIVQDIFAVLFLVFAAGKVPSPWALLIPPILFIARPVLLFLLERSGHGEMLILFGFFMALVPGAHLFDVMCLKQDLGALAAGMLIAHHPKAKELAETMMGFKDFFLIGFFLLIGFSGIPTPDMLLLAFIIALGINFKVLLYLLVFTRFRLRARTAVNAALPLANFSEFGLIIVSISAARGLLEPHWLITLAVSLSMSFLVSAPLNTYSHRIYASIGRRLRLFETGRRLEYDRTIDIGDAEILIFGMGHLGTATYDQLRKQYGQRLLAIDYDGERVRNLRGEGRNVVQEDATDSDFWEKVARKPLDQVKLVLLCMNEHTANLQALEFLKSISYGGKIAATAKFDDEVRELREAGVDSAYNLYTEAGVGFADQVCSTLGVCGFIIE